MFLTSTLDICAYEVALSWTPYVGWSNIDSYEIWGQIVGQNWVLFGTTTNTSFTADVIGLEDYCFFIKAINSSGNYAFSNRTCLTIVAPTDPSYHYLQVATVENEAIRLNHLVESASGVQAIQFEKMDKDGVFQNLVQVPVTSDNMTYLDTDVEVNRFSYTYRARVVDSCGRPGTASNIGKSILLNVQKDDVRLLTYLNWTPYIQFDGSVISYNLYRGIDDVFSTVPLATLSNDVLSFTDDLNSVTFTGKVCYYVEAIEGSNLYNDPQISRSNEACEVFEPILYVPNAFMPDGVNKIFIPVITNFDPTDYRFTIFDRWGQVLFQTTTPEEGWNGSIAFSNKMAETATYVYMITMHDGNGIEIVKRGHVTLLK
jgi:gliding motility-associated-like protein